MLSIGHVEDGRGILDALVEHRPPFSPESVITDLAEVLRGYHLSATTGDRYASGFNAELFAKHGITYNYSTMTTWDYFGSLLPILNSRRCVLLDNRRLASQLCALERRPSRIGAKDSIGHPPQGHDDLAAATAGLMVRMIGIRDFSPKSFVVPLTHFPPPLGSSKDCRTSFAAQAILKIQPHLAAGVSNWRQRPRTIWMDGKTLSKLTT